MPPEARPAAEVMRLRSERAFSTGVFNCGSCRSRFWSRSSASSSASASMPWLRTLGFGFSTGFCSTGFGFSGSGFSSGSGGGGGGGGFGFSTMSCTTRSGRSSGFDLRTLGLGQQPDDDREHRRDDQQDAQQPQEAPLGFFAGRPRKLEPAEIRS